MTDFSDLPPHLIFGKILFPCPTKVAVELSFILSKKYWDQDVVSHLVPVLDFDEDDNCRRHKLKVWDINLQLKFRQHEKFVRFVEGYLEYYRLKGHKLLDKLRLHMRLNSSEDATILGRWLELAFERGVKELEISHPFVNPVYHPLSWMNTFANAKSLTSLKLAFVRLTAFEKTWDETDDFLPSLKTLSLESLEFVENDNSLYKLLHTCSSIEYLSLNRIPFEYSEFHLPTYLSSLKSLEFIDCDPPEVVVANSQAQVDILESFTWIGDGCIETFCWEMVLCMTGKSLTCLRIENVEIVYSRSANGTFPSLKTISIKNVQNLDLLRALPECPSLENLSLVDCHLKKSTCCVRSSTLKSLEVKHCGGLELLQVQEANNLESFTFFSQPLRRDKTTWTSKLSTDSDSKYEEVISDNSSDSDSESAEVILDDSFNLRRNYICHADLRNIYLESESDSDSKVITDNSLDSKSAEVILDNTFNLKNNDICVTDLVKFSINGCHYVSGGHLNLKGFFDGIAPYARNNIKISNEAFFD